MTAHILFREQGGWGIITLNRPKALNALTHEMVQALRRRLLDWAEADHIRAIMIEGQGEKAFCAGGDVMALVDSVEAGDDSAWAFFHDEYMCNAAIAMYPKPYVAVIDGIVMGGGVGVSVHGDFRIATDNTMFAMPETAIGLFPDVGGSYFLPRLRPGLGMYLGLTGARVRGYEAVATGIATHYVPQGDLSGLKDALLSISFDDDAAGEIRSVLEAAHRQGDATKVIPHLVEIEAIFGDVENLGAIFSKLEQSGTSFARDTLETLKSHSPTALQITFAAVQAGAEKDIVDVLRMELRLATRAVQLPDFSEGVRAKLLDKGRTPVWSLDDVAQVSQADIQLLFESLGDKELSWAD